MNGKVQITVQWQLDSTEYVLKRLFKEISPTYDVAILYDFLFLWNIKEDILRNVNTKTD